MTWRTIMAFLHLIPLPPPTVFGPSAERSAVRQALADHQEAAREAQSATLDMIEVQQLDPRRDAMKRNTAALRETLAAVAMRAGRQNND